MKKSTIKLLLAALGGSLLALGLLSGYNVFSVNSPIYGIPAVLFLIGGGIALWKSFE